MRHKQTPGAAGGYATCALLQCHSSLAQATGPRGSDLFLLDLPLAARDGVGDHHHRENSSADAPYLLRIRIGAAEQVIIYPIDENPYQQRDAGENLVEYQPAMLTDQDVARADDDNSPDRPAPDMELVQHRLAEPVIQC